VHPRARAEPSSVAAPSRRSGARQIILRRIDELSAVIEEVTGRIDTELAPIHDVIEELVTIPGVDRKAAAVIIAETGADMSRFASAGHLASWADICPGSHESGGISKSGKTRVGNKPLGGALGTAALSAARTKNNYLYPRVPGASSPTAESNAPASPWSIRS
jgi:transposase